jgi:hypothetical protein
MCDARCSIEWGRGYHHVDLSEVWNGHDTSDDARVLYVIMAAFAYRGYPMMITAALSH